MALDLEDLERKGNAIAIWPDPAMRAEWHAMIDELRRLRVPAAEHVLNLIDDHISGPIKMSDL